MQNNFKGSKGEVKAIFTSDNARAVRNSGGLICKLLKPSKYQDQYERYEKELEENKEDQKLITDAFNIRQQINFDLPELLEQRNKAVELLDRVRLGEFPEKEIKQFLKTIEK